MESWDHQSRIGADKLDAPEKIGYKITELVGRIGTSYLRPMKGATTDHPSCSSSRSFCSPTVYSLI